MAIFTFGWLKLILTISGLLILLRMYLKSRVVMYRGKERLDGKTVIVTGANSGIGLEAAKDLARRGARVIMLCRDMVKAQKVRELIIKETRNTNVKVKHINFASLSSVRECAQELLNEEQSIHVLLNNAGVAGQGIHMTEDGLESVMQTNHFGPFLLTNILLDKLKKSAPSRIVNVSSLMYKASNLDMDHLDMSNTTSETRIYSNSKVANIYFTTDLAQKLHDTGVTVNCLHPGVIRTDITRRAPGWMQLMLQAITPFLRTPVEGAQTSIYLCVSPDVANISGQYFSNCCQADCWATRPDKAEEAKRLWEMSEVMVQMKPHERRY